MTKKRKNKSKPIKAHPLSSILNRAAKIKPEDMKGLPDPAEPAMPTPEPRASEADKNIEWMRDTGIVNPVAAAYQIVIEDLQGNIKVDRIDLVLGTNLIDQLKRIQPDDY